MADERQPCPFCGERHEPGPVGEPSSFMAGIEIKVCSNIPPDHFYVDQEYKRGPRGALFRVA